MGLNAKKIFQLSGGIAAAIATGGASAAILPALGLAAELIPGPNKKKQDLEGWERAMIAEWIDLYQKLMDIPMNPEVKRNTVMGKLRSDFIRRYADIPKERWVEQIHMMLVLAVHGELAVAGLDT